MELIFPYANIRAVQQDLINDIKRAVSTRTHIIAHAPTGLGKTIAALYVCLPYALENKLTIFFLTSRHTQHQIAIDTLKAIQEKNNLRFGVADMIGKKWMCIQKHVETMSSGDFSEFCKQMVEHATCEFYTNVRQENKMTPLAIRTIEELEMGISHSEELIHCGKTHSLCPYELAVELAKKATVIIGDYYYLFNPYVQETFFRKINKDISKCIVIVDEAHNLPDRIRELASDQLSGITLRKAVQEAKKFHYTETIAVMSQINDVLLNLSGSLKLGQEKLVKKEQFTTAIEKIDEYSKIMDDLLHLSTVVREMQKQSALGSVAQFLSSWQGPDIGFARIISLKEVRKEPAITLTYRCLDPALIAKNTIAASYCTILMSGTLTPTSMYKDILGIEKALEHEYVSPFPDHNRLNLVVPMTTTKFSMRSQQQYRDIADICSRIIQVIPGNCILFFPSYSLRDAIMHLIKTTKKIFVERPQFTKEEKYALMDAFKQCKDTGAVILGVVGGSFGEGIDLPGDYLKGVVIVGLPLEPPDLETKERISYLEHRLGRGWDYGYVFPAFNKVLQNAGRCIRSETDKGVIVFLDQRYLWPMYKRCFPETWEMEVSKEYEEDIERFFKMRG